MARDKHTDTNKTETKSHETSLLSYVGNSDCFCFHSLFLNIFLCWSRFTKLSLLPTNGSQANIRSFCFQGSVHTVKALCKDKKKAGRTSHLLQKAVPAHMTSASFSFLVTCCLCRKESHPECVYTTHALTFEASLSLCPLHCPLPPPSSPTVT